MQSPSQLAVERVDGVPAVVTYARIGGAIYAVTLATTGGLSLWWGSVTDNVELTLYAYVIAFFAALNVVPALLATFAPRSDRSGRMFFTIFGAWMTMSAFFLLPGILLIIGVNTPDVREWFEGKRLKASAKQATRVGYGVLGLVAMIALAVNIGLGVILHLAGEEQAQKQARLKHREQVYERVDLGDAATPRASFIAQAYTRTPHIFFGDPIPFDVEGTYLDGRPWQPKPNRATLYLAWSTTCLDSEPQLEALPTSPDYDVVLATLDCGRAGFDPGRAREKLSLVPDRDVVDVVCFNGAEWPLRISWTPTVFLVDAQSRIRFSHEGLISAERLNRIAAQLR